MCTRLMKTLVLMIVVMLSSNTLGQARAQEIEDKGNKTCSHSKYWNAKQQIQNISENSSNRNVDLCNASLTGIKLNGAKLGYAKFDGADLSFADLSDAELFGADFTMAILFGAKLTGANLSGATFAQANLTGANLTETDLSSVSFTNAILSKADLTKAKSSLADFTYATLSETIMVQAILNGAKLNNAIFSATNLTKAYLSAVNLSGTHLNSSKFTGANLSEANLSNAKLESVDMSEADLNGAKLFAANLTKADLTKADLTKAQLVDATLTEAILTESRLAFSNLQGATYAPASPPPNHYLEGMKGLSTVIFPEGSGSVLVQLREMLQRTGLRDLEREATYAIESNRTRHTIISENSNLISQLEGRFRFLLFELTTGYGLYPGRALRFITYLGFMLVFVYIWPIRFSPQRSAPASRPSGSIYRIWSTDRVETVWDAEYQSEEILMRSGAKIERLVGGRWFALRYALYFSLLSAFSIGWKDFNVGSWIARIQGREYALRATGWVRVVSGLQSLLSVYLLAIWALTYFGRPFQ
jgi:uncharacterized protein YjbI with pentapeptide repeats